MSSIRFYVVNIISAMVWAPVYILPGYLVGASMPEVSSSASGNILIVLVMLAGSGLFFAFMGSHIHNRIQPPDHLLVTSGRLLVGGRHLMLVSSISLAIITSLVVIGELKFVSAAITQWLVSNHTGLMNRIMVAITLIGSHDVQLIWFGFAAIWLVINRQWKLALALCFLMAGIDGLLCLMKWGLDVNRPDNPAGRVHLSFPSGHTTSTMFLSLWLARYLALTVPPGLRRPWLWGVGIIIAILVGFSRLYLRMHWMTDVLGGMALGTLGFSMWLILCGRFCDTRPPRYAAGLIAALLVSSTVVIAMKFPTTLTICFSG